MLKISFTSAPPRDSANPVAKFDSADHSIRFLLFSFIQGLNPPFIAIPFSLKTSRLCSHRARIFSNPRAPPLFPQGAAPTTRSSRQCSRSPSISKLYVCAPLPPCASFFGYHAGAGISRCLNPFGSKSVIFVVFTLLYLTRYQGVCQILSNLSFINNEMGFFFRISQSFPPRNLWTLHCLF